MKQTIITKIQKVEEAKAELLYMVGNSKLRRSTRTLYDNEVLLFKGIRLAVKFNEEGKAYKVNKIGIYDKGVRQDDSGRMEKIGFQTDNGIEDVEELEQLDIPKKEEPKQDGVVKHEKFEQIKTLVDAEIPVYLYGPAGSGKNHVLQQIAEE